MCSTRCPICQCGYSTQAALKVHMAHHHSKSKFKCVLCNNLEFHSQLALEGHIYTKHSKENNDLNELINETRGRYTQPTKLDYTANTKHELPSSQHSNNGTNTNQQQNQHNNQHIQHNLQQGGNFNHNHTGEHQNNPHSTQNNNSNETRYISGP